MSPTALQGSLLREPPRGPHAETWLLDQAGTVLRAAGKLLLRKVPADPVQRAVGDERRMDQLGYESLRCLTAGSQLQQIEQNSPLATALLGLSTGMGLLSQSIEWRRYRERHGLPVRVLEAERFHVEDELLVDCRRLLLHAREQLRARRSERPEQQEAGRAA